jgi:hypothetical protein
VTATSNADSNLAYSTTYQYRVVAESSAGDSPPSSVVLVTTLAQPDLLAGQSLSITLTTGSTFTGPVAAFTDAQAATPAGRFIAAIAWGDGQSTLGTVSGSGGEFTVLGAHVYSRVGVYALQVTVSMSEPDVTRVTIESNLQVVAKAKHPQSSSRHTEHRVVRKAKRPAARHRR